MPAGCKRPSIFARKKEKASAARNISDKMYTAIGGRTARVLCYGESRRTAPRPRNPGVNLSMLQCSEVKITGRLKFVYQRHEVGGYSLARPRESAVASLRTSIRCYVQGSCKHILYPLLFKMDGRCAALKCCSLCGNKSDTPTHYHSPASLHSSVNSRHRRALPSQVRSR